MKKNLSRALALLTSPGVYPAVTACVITLGYVTRLDFFAVVLSTLLFCLSILYKDSFLPGVSFFVTLVYAITPVHSPGAPHGYNTYLIDGWRGMILCVCACLLAVSLGIYLIRGKKYRRIRSMPRPLLICALALGIGLTAAGIFSEEWSGRDAILGAIEALVICGAFFYLWCALSEKDVRSLPSHLCYCALWITLILAAELITVYLTGDEVFLADGSIRKESILLGWGTWTNYGCSAVVLIPLLCYGATRSRAYPVYLCGAMGALLCAVFSMSRSALLFGGLFFGIGVIFGIVNGRNRKPFLVFLCVGLIALVLLALTHREKIILLFSDFAVRGLSDNGRLDIWEWALGKWKRAPLFGAGYYAMSPEGWGQIYPRFVHNTLIQMLTSGGVFTLCAYCVFRVLSVRAALHRATPASVCLFFCMLAFLGMALLDIFFFGIHLCFLYQFCSVYLYRRREPVCEAA